LDPCMFVDFCALIAKSVPLCGQEVLPGISSSWPPDELGQREVQKFSVPDNLWVSKFLIRGH